MSFAKWGLGTACHLSETLPYIWSKGKFAFWSVCQFEYYLCFLRIFNDPLSLNMQLYLPITNQTWRWFDFQTKTGNSVILLQLFLKNFLMDDFESNWAADSVKTLILKCRRLLPLFWRINVKLLLELITQILIGTGQRVDIKFQCQALM